MMQDQDTLTWKFKCPVCRITCYSSEKLTNCLNCQAVFLDSNGESYKQPKGDDKLE